MAALSGGDECGLHLLEFVVAELGVVKALAVVGSGEEGEYGAHPRLGSAGVVVELDDQPFAAAAVARFVWLVSGPAEVDVVVAVAAVACECSLESCEAVVQVHDAAVVVCWSAWRSSRR